ncbi:MAG TPA: response regulator [Anaerolineae bacterium]|nr:response regulator [Anaerolineae bacterium]HID84435.1 response regulator [Anaerolineales bacterium]HIQ09284.1 response regulator [Anaerolineaceae bacterium]
MVAERILCVDDEPEMVELLRLILGRRGYEIVGVYSGQEALETLKGESVDLILLDLMMPGMDGWEVVRRLRANEATASIPVIVVTAKSQNVDRVLGLHIVKVDDYITKPFTPRELLDAVQRVLNKRGAATESDDSALGSTEKA